MSEDLKAIGLYLYIAGVTGPVGAAFPELINTVFVEFFIENMSYRVSAVIEIGVAFIHKAGRIDDDFSRAALAPPLRFAIDAPGIFESAIH